MEFVNNVPLGPNSVKVVIETAFEEDAFLWRPVPNFFTIGQAVGETVVWPQDSVLVLEEELSPDDSPANVRFSFLISFSGLSLYFVKYSNVFSMLDLFV